MNNGALKYSHVNRKYSNIISKQHIKNGNGNNNENNNENNKENYTYM